MINDHEIRSQKKNVRIYCGDEQSNARWYSFIQLTY